MVELPEEGAFSGVDTIIARMASHPEEFFETQNNRLAVEKYGGGRWAFIYKEYFRDAMTESEKGRLHEALRTVRRLEFDAMVLKELMRDEEAEKRQELERQMRAAQQAVHTQALSNQYQYQGQQGLMNSTLQASPFGAVPKQEER